MKVILFGILFLFLGIQHSLCQSEFYVTEKIDLSTRSSNEANAVPFKNGLVFVANYKTEILRSYVTQDQIPTYDIYISYLDSDGKWKNPILFSRQINAKIHEGPFCFNEDKSKMYFTKNIDNNFRASNTLGIFIADLQDTLVKEVNSFPYNSSDFNTAYPSLSGDGKTLYFCNDNRDTGNGGYDIYKSELKNGEWSQPENLGAKINTNRDEVLPFIHSSDRLYFSSEGHPGVGRLDIFYSRQLEGNWITPVNLGSTINSKRDDAGIFFTNDAMTEGYFSSDQDRTLDIFKISSTFPEFTECTEIQENQYCYVFFETGSMDLDSTSLSYEWDMGDGTKVRGLEANHCFDGPGKYNIALNVIDTLTGDVYFSEASYEFELKDHIQTYITSPDTSYVGTPVSLNASKSNINFEIEKNIYYWDFNDYELAQGMELSHTFFDPGEYVVKLGVVESVKRNQEPEKICNYKTIVILPKK